MFVREGVNESVMMKEIGKEPLEEETTREAQIDETVTTCVFSLFSESEEQKENNGERTSV